MTTTTVHDSIRSTNAGERSRAIWSSGDFHIMARQTMGAAEDLCRAADPRPGHKVLDVACGSGNAALVAARRYCEVAGIDIAPSLIETARVRAQAEACTIDWRVGDAQDLPFDDGSFDVVLSVFGVMFAPDQTRAARELLRVCRPGGLIALANWMPGHFGADLFAAHARCAPPPPGTPSSLRWGTEEDLRSLLGDGVGSLRTQPQVTWAYYRSPDHAVSLFQRYFGPTVHAMSVAGAERAEGLRRDLADVLARYNRARDGSAVIEMRYLQAMAVRH